MDLKIVEQKENKILGRKELTARAAGKEVPSKQQVRDKLSALVNAPAEAIAVTKISTNFGSANAVISARIYASAEELRKKEPKHMRERNFGKEKKEGEATQSEAPAKFKK